VNKQRAGQLNKLPVFSLNKTLKQTIIMSDKLIKEFNKLFVEVQNDINTYLNDDCVECHADDIDKKLEDARNMFVDLIKNFQG
jgi:hypothetical protein